MRNSQQLRRSDLSTHRLTIFENAIDSLNEGLRKYDLGEDDHRAFKFSVLHVAHFVELYFKSEVVKRHRLFLYKNPFESPKKRTRTIDLWDALQFLENDGVEISKSLRVDLDWFKALRNQIEHSHFEMNTQDVKDSIGRLIKAVEDFSTIHDEEAIEDVIDAACKDTYRALIDEYSARIREARIRIKKEGLVPTYCNICRTIDVAISRETFVECYLCKQTDPLAPCSDCGKLKPVGGMAHMMPADYYTCAKCLFESDSGDYLEDVMG
jgi:hypothetical protein